MYATLADIVARFGETEVLQVADRDGDGIADAEVIAAALADADQAIDGYLGVRFALPLSTVPQLVQSWAAAIARYRLHRDGPPDYVVRDYKDALQALRDAGAGKIALPDIAGLKPAEDAAAGGVLAASAPEVFSDQALEGWR